MIHKQRFKRGFIYLMVSNSKGWHKIGITQNSPARRLWELREAAPNLDIDLLAVIPSDDCERLERALLTNFRNNALAAEKWRELGLKRDELAAIGTSEWFNLADAQVKLFLAIAETTGGNQANAVVKEWVAYHSRMFKHAETQRNALAAHLEHVMREADEELEELQEEHRTLREESQRLQATNKILKDTLISAAKYCEQYHKKV